MLFVNTRRRVSGATVVIIVLLTLFLTLSALRRLQNAQREPIPSKINKRRPVHLIGQWYWPVRPHRARELVRALAKNVNNTIIHKIHLIQPAQTFLAEEVRLINSSNTASMIVDVMKAGEINAQLQAIANRYFSELTTIDPYFPFEIFTRKLIIGVTQHRGRLLASDAFRHASTHPAFRETTSIAVLANQDIYFDSSLDLLDTHPDSDLSTFTAFFLSRYEESPRAEKRSRIGTQCGPRFVGSHDAFVFVPPLPNTLIDRTSFELGSWGLEARLMWEFEKSGLTVRNPCEDIKSWHVHLGGIKDIEVGGDGGGETGNNASTRVMPVVNGDGKSSIAFPEGLTPKYRKLADELWGMQAQRNVIA